MECVTSEKGKKETEILPKKLAWHTGKPYDSPTEHKYPTEHQLQIG